MEEIIIIEICKCKIEDAKEFLNMLLKLDEETKYMLFEKEERPTNLDLIENIINESINGNNLSLVLKSENSIIGFLSVKRSKLNRIKHIGYIVIGIREKYRYKGFGNELFKYMDIWARKNNIVRMELTVVCENISAKKLYERNGFKIEGIKEKAVLIDGKYLDEYYMAKIY